MLPHRYPLDTGKGLSKFHDHILNTIIKKQLPRQNKFLHKYTYFKILKSDQSKIISSVPFSVFLSTVYIVLKLLPHHQNNSHDSAVFSLTCTSAIKSRIRDTSWFYFIDISDLQSTTDNAERIKQHSSACP